MARKKDLSRSNILQFSQEEYDEIKNAPLRKTSIERHKYFYQVIALILVCIIVISFMHFGRSFISYFFSSPLKENSLSFEDYTFVFEPLALGKFYSIFSQNQDREIKMCFFGKKVNSTYILSSGFEPKIYNANIVHVVSSPCPKETIAELHSHPNGDCFASETDINTYNMIRKTAPDRKFLIVCQENRFSLY